MPADGQLFANGFESGQTFVFDLRDPARPRIVEPVRRRRGLFAPALVPPAAERQRARDVPDAARARGWHAPGGIVELTPAGAAGAFAARPMRPGMDPELRVYSAGDRPGPRPDRDDHDRHARGFAGLAPRADLAPVGPRAAAHVPAARRPGGDEGLLTAEPRLLADGKTVLVSTFSCGLYLMEGLESDAPSARLVASFPRKPDDLLRDPGHRRPLLPGHGARLERRREPRHQRSRGAARGQPRHAGARRRAALDRDLAGSAARGVTGYEGMSTAW